MRCYKTICAFFPLFILLMIVSCRSKSNTTLLVTAETNKNDTINTKDLKYLIFSFLQKKESSFNPENITINSNGNTLAIEVHQFPEKEEPNNFLAMLSNYNDGIKFYEAYSNTEIVPLLIALNDSIYNLHKDTAWTNPNAKTLQEQPDARRDSSEFRFNTQHPLTRLINFNAGNNQTLYPSAVIGYCKKEDTATFFKLTSLQVAQKILPSTIHILPGQTNKGGLIEIFALKTTGKEKNAAIQGNSIEFAKKKMLEEYGYPVIDLKFSPNYVETWRKLTKKCAPSFNEKSRAIAIVIDGRVISAPMVNCEIPNGLAQISGDFSEREIDDFCRKLNMPYMPYKLKILNFEIKENGN